MGKFNNSNKSNSGDKLSSFMVSKIYKKYSKLKDNYNFMYIITDCYLCNIYYIIINIFLIIAVAFLIDIYLIKQKQQRTHVHAAGE